MSIVKRLDELVGLKKLFHRPSSYSGISARNMYLPPDIHAITHRPFADTQAGERHAHLAAYLDAFAELNMITVSQNPDRKPAETMLARVNPVKAEFWSMRVDDGAAGMRVIGTFCATDTFVGLGCEFREYMNPFDDDVRDAMERWTDLFGFLPPLSRSNLSDYITNAREF